MQSEKVTLPKRHGITAVMRAAEILIYSQAEACLSPLRYEELNAAKGGGLFLAGNYPGPDWKQVLGFAPDQQLFYQVTVGIADDPGRDANIFAKALISRDVSNDFCHIVWEPPRQSG